MKKRLKDSLQCVRHACYCEKGQAEAFSALIKDNLADIYDEDGNIWKSIVSEINEKIEKHNRITGAQTKPIDFGLTFAYLEFLFDGHEDDFEKGILWYFSN